MYSTEEIEEYYTADLFIDLLLKAEWHEVLSIVEFLINKGPVTMSQVKQLFDYHNVGYEVEKHGRREYRVIVKYSALIAENERVLSSGIPHAPVVQAISAAKDALIDPRNIDVSTSIKLSVDAVEAYLKEWLEERGRSVVTLGDAIKEMKRHSLCPGHILDSLSAFYVYRNRTENVGHGSPRFAELSREDALLCNEMSVSLINYFHRKGTLLPRSKPPDSTAVSD